MKTQKVKKFKDFKRFAINKVLKRIINEDVVDC